MTDRLVERGVPREKALTSFNWADERFARATGAFDVAPMGFDGHFNFVFGGNLGSVQGLDAVIRAAQAAGAQNPRIRLTIVGEGVELERLRELVRDLGASNVHFWPALPVRQIGDVFAVADVLLVHLVDDPLFEITIPSKVQFYLAMGRPILVGVNGESSEIVTNARAGIAARSSDVADIARAMVQMASLPGEALFDMGRRGREAYIQDYSFTAGVTALATCLDGLAMQSVPVQGAKYGA